MNRIFNVLGLMSGTSVDGLDIALVSFENLNDKWNFKILKALTKSFPMDLQKQLLSAHLMSGLELKYLENQFSEFCASSIISFKNNISERIDLIASHGHTVFHQPEKGISLQIGNAELIAKLCEITVVSDFRTGDLALGGQGAPLVPIGDDLLFSEFDACINLGGFSNISFKNESLKRVAYDICPMNIVLNSLANKLGLDFDNKGKIAAVANVNENLISELNNLEYYSLNYPKSLAREWVEVFVNPILNKYSKTESYENLIASFTNHAATQIANNLKGFSNVLFSGGGVYNDFLIQTVRNMTKSKIIIPPNEIIDFKEALVFAFLALLRWQNKINCLASVTGAKRDSCCGKVSLA